MNGAARPSGAAKFRRVLLLVAGLSFVTLLLALGCGKTGSTSAGLTPSCIPPALACNGRCADISSDAQNCGACGAACPAGDACVGGACDSQDCPAGRSNCGGLCVDLKSNPLNCGSCNKACSGAETCVGGSCTCAAPARECAGACIGTGTSAQHCGSCDHACAPDELCSAGSCQPRCAQPLISCGDRCADPMSDPQACGNCQTTCAGAEVCNAGHCECPNDAVHMLCDGSCIDIQNEAGHCGGCGNRCAAGQRCASGLCTACQSNFFFCPSAGDPLETCLAQARAATGDAGTALSPDLECQCKNCLVELQDCVSDGTCVGTWQCALKNSCTTSCWGTMGVCSLGGGPGCFKWCPPTGTPQTAARVEALMRCTRDKGCGR